MCLRVAEWWLAITLHHLLAPCPCPPHGDLLQWPERRDLGCTAEHAHMRLSCASFDLRPDHLLFSSGDQTQGLISATQALWLHPHPSLFFILIKFSLQYTISWQRSCYPKEPREISPLKKKLPIQFPFLTVCLFFLFSAHVRIWEWELAKALSLAFFPPIFFITVVHQ